MTERTDEHGFTVTDAVTLARAFHAAYELLERASFDRKTSRVASGVLNEAATVLQMRAEHWARLAADDEPRDQSEALARVSFRLWWASIYVSQPRELREIVDEFAEALRAK
jgi:hypothetical protein